MSLLVRMSTHTHTHTQGSYCAALGSLVLNLYRYFTCNLTFCVATSQSERTVQALRQSVEVAERRAIEVEERANTQVQEVKIFDF